MHIDVYQTDWGPVQVSETEASLLRAEDNIRRWHLPKSAWERVLVRAEMLRADINKFARWKHDRA